MMKSFFLRIVRIPGNDISSPKARISYYEKYTYLDKLSFFEKRKSQEFRNLRKRERKFLNLTLFKSPEEKQETSCKV